MAEENVSVPFLRSTSFISREVEPVLHEVPSVVMGRSPFVMRYEGEGEVVDGVSREAYAAVVESLHDEEFDEALFELMDEARGIHQDHLAAGNSQTDADRLLTQHFARLTTASEEVIDSVAREVEARNGAGYTSEEIAALGSSYAPRESEGPVSEQFLGKLLNKARALASVGANLAIKVAMGPMMALFKKFAPNFINRVLQFVIGKLPEAVRPAAHKLAQRLGLAPKAAAELESEAEVETESAGGEVASLQEELNEQLAQALLANKDEEVELELEAARAHSSAATSAPVYSNLDEAREQFIQGLQELRSGESAEPLVQHFLPALLPALRLGIKLAKRPRVVKFLGGFVAKLIGKLIGPELAPALSNAIVDAGLRLMSLEMSEDERSGLAASAAAATVEEALVRVAALPDHVLDNQELLEGFALEAFEQAAAANLPAVLSEATYEQRPELLEGGVNAAWVHAPRRGRRRYKHCSRSFPVRITPHMAEELETFEGVPLSEVLQEQLGLPEGAEVEAEVRLYEALPGTTAGDIARGESETLGGPADEVSKAQLHPLTPAAASTLLGRPGLGRAVPDLDARNVTVGQRLYHLKIPGARALTIPGVGGRRRVRRLSHINVVLDGAKDQVRVVLFLSETRAQKLAVRIRQQTHAGTLATAFHKFLARRLKPLLQGRHRRRLRIVHASLPAGHGLHRLPAPLIEAFGAKAQEWLTHAFATFAKDQGQQFLAAADNPALGVTLRFTVEQPRGLKELLLALTDKGHAAGAVAQALADKSQPNVRVEVLPGHRCA